MSRHVSGDDVQRHLDVLHEKLRDYVEELRVRAVRVADNLGFDGTPSNQIRGIANEIERRFVPEWLRVKEGEDGS